MPHAPANGAAWSSIAATTAATSPANRGASGWGPGPQTNGGVAIAPWTVAVNHRPPSPYAWVERTIAYSTPAAATAVSAIPLARRNGCAADASAPGTDRRTNRFVRA